ncbi:MAG: hypothetical protein ACQEUT_18500, partial [Bacillota bacterium]
TLFLYLKKGEIPKQIFIQRRSEDGEEQEGRGHEGENTGVGSAHEDVNERSGRRDSPLIAVLAFSADGSWGSPCESRTSPGDQKSTRSGALFCIEKNKREIPFPPQIHKTQERGMGRSKKVEDTRERTPEWATAHEDVSERSGRRDSPLIAVLALSADGSWGSPCESRTSPGKLKEYPRGALFCIEKNKREIPKQIFI